MADATGQVVDDTKSEAEAAAAEKIDDGADTAVEMAEMVTGSLALRSRDGSTSSASLSNQLESDSAVARTNQPATRQRVPRPVPAEPVRFAGNGLGATLRATSEPANRASLTISTSSRTLSINEFPKSPRSSPTHMTTVVRRMANQARTVVDDAAKKLDAHGYGRDDGRRR